MEDNPCCPQVRARSQAAGVVGVSLTQFIPCPARGSTLRLLPYANPPVPPQTALSVSLPTETSVSSPGGTVPYLGFSSVPRSRMLCAFAVSLSAGAVSPTPPPPCQCHIHLQPVSPKPAGGLKKKIINRSPFRLVWMISPVPEARTLLLFLLWLFTKSLPALDPAAAFLGLERVCKENSTGEIAGVGCSHPGCSTSQIQSPA